MNSIAPRRRRVPARRSLREYDARELCEPMESVTRQFCFEEIPEELRQQNNWVDWRFERRMKDGARRNPL